MKNKSILQSLRFLTLLGLMVLGIGNAWGQTTPTVLFHETFGNNSGSARTWSDTYSVKSGVAAVYSKVTSYTVSNAKQSKNTMGSTQSGLTQTTSGTDAYIIIGPLNVATYQSLALTYQWKAASIKGTYSTKLYYATSSTGTYTEVTGTGNGATSFVTRSYSLPAAAQVSTLYLKIVWNTSNAQAIIDEVELTGTVGKTLSSIAVKTQPTKVEYVAGDNFNPAGLVITATYNDDSTEDINYVDNESKFTFEPSLSTALKTTDNSVTITYGEKTTTQTITVNAASGKSVTCIAKPTDGGNPTASPSSNIAAETTVELTANPATGYTFTSWYAIDGEAQEITVTDNKFTMPATDVEVEATYTPIAVIGVTLNKESLSLSVGATETLTATIAPADALVKTVTWSSSDPTVATVDQTGKVTAVSAGTANITVTTEDGSYQASCAVTVTEPVDYVTLPFKWNGGTRAELLANVGVTANGLGDDYVESHAPYRVKLDDTGDYILIKTNEAVGSVKVNVKMIGGKTSSKIIVQGSATENGEYTDIQTLTISGSQNDICQLSTTNDIDDYYRYIRLYFTKGANVGVGYIELTKAAAKHTVTFASTENGSFTAAIGGNPVTTGTEVKAGSTVSLTPSPSLHYHLNAWNVYKTGESGTTVTVEDNSFIMPDYNVTIGATFEEDTKYTVTAKGNIGGKYTVKVGDADPVEVDGVDVTFSNLYANTAFTLTSVSANDGYKIGSTPFALAVEDGKTKPTLSKTDNDNVKTFTLGDCDVTITASFPKLYNITANNGTHGTSLTFQDKDGNTITKASYKTNVTVVVGTPNEGYQLDRLYYITDEEVDTPVEVTIENNKFEMPQYNVTVYATYKVIPYTLTYDKGDESVQGDVPVDETVYSVENPTATLASADGLTRTGYVFAGWSDGNAVYQQGVQYTVTGNTTMTAQWTEIHEFTASSSSNGTFTATYGSQTCSSSDEDSINVPAGKTVTLTVSPATEYRCDGFKFVSGSTATKISDTKWTFVMPNDDEMAQAIFVSTVATFAASVDESIEHGSITLTPASGELSAQKIGDKIYLSNTPDTHYKLTEWLFDDGEEYKDIDVLVEDGTNKQYFLMPGYNVTVSATFSEYYTITTSVTGNGSIGVQLGDQVAPTTTIDCYVGTSVTATATPASEDDEFKSWTISGTEYSSTNNVATFTMPKSDVSISATFDAIPTYTLTYHIKGVSNQIENVRRDTNVKSLLSEVVTGDNFHAWSTTEDATRNYLLSDEATMQGDMNVYAVYEIEGTSTWTKVTSNPQDWTGEYALVYETTVEDVPTAFIWTGVDNDSCYVSATIDDNTIEMPSGAAKLSINPMTGGYSIKVVGGTNDGKYISGKSGDNNLIYSDEAVLNTLAYSSDSTTTLITSNTSVMRWNDNSNQKRFRYYKSSGYKDQQAIQLYKKSTGESTYSLEIPYNVTLNSIDGDHFYGTVCLPTDFTIATDDVKAFKAAKSGSVVTMTSITEETNHVAAGEPVVLYCKAVGTGENTMTATLTKNVTEKVDAPKPSDGNVLSGTFSDIVITDATKSDYLGFGAATISGVKQVGFFSIKSGNKIGAYKAYIDTKEQDIKSFVLDLDDTPTGINNVDADADADADMLYNLAGQKLNKLQKGINIVNGKKVYVQ